MKLSIGYRLFLMLLLFAGIVAAVGLELVRWRLFDNFSAPRHVAEFDRLAGLRDDLTAQYRKRHDWSFLPGAPAQRKRWLRDRLQLTSPSPAMKTPLPADLAYRVGLRDRDGRYLAGAVASTPVIAFASVDTVRRPLLVDGATVGYLEIAQSQQPDDSLTVAFLVDQQGNLARVALFGVLLSAVLAALLALHFRRPIRQLASGARRLADGKFATRLDDRRRDELGELAASFNQMAIRLEQAEQSRRQWVADTSHELRTPLAVLRGQLEALQDGVRAASPENIALMLRQIQALTQQVDALYQLARADTGQLACEPADIEAWPLVVESVQAFADRFRTAGLTVWLAEPPPRSGVRADADRLRQVLGNLLENCARYTEAGGRIEIRCAVAEDSVCLTIDDSAPGVPPAAIERLGERYFRVDAARSRHTGGAGLGLAVCRQVLDAQGGRLELAASPLGGLRATVILPRGA